MFASELGSEVLTTECGVIAAKLIEFGAQPELVASASTHSVGRMHDNQIDAPGPNGKTLLHQSVSTNDIDIVKVLLLDRGASVEVQDNKGRTPLHYVPNNIEMTQLLLEQGADANAQDKEGQTALHMQALQTSSWNLEQCEVRAMIE